MYTIRLLPIHPSYTISDVVYILVQVLRIMKKKPVTFVRTYTISYVPYVKIYFAGKEKLSFRMGLIRGFLKDYRNFETSEERLTMILFMHVTPFIMRFCGRASMFNYPRYFARLSSTGVKRPRTDLRRMTNSTQPSVIDN